MQFSSVDRLNSRGQQIGKQDEFVIVSTQFAIEEVCVGGGNLYLPNHFTYICVCVCEFFISGLHGCSKEFFKKSKFYIILYREKRHAEYQQIIYTTISWIMESYVGLMVK